MKKRTLAIIALSLILAMALGACGAASSSSSAKSSAPASSASSAKSSTASSASSSKSSAASSAASSGAATGKPIAVGCIQDLSGSASEAGKANDWGAKYAVEQINKNGGINGRPIELISMDCKNDVQEGVNCYRLLVDEKKVAAIIGPPLSNPALAWVDLAKEDKIPIVGHFMDESCTTNNDTGKVYDYMFLGEPGCKQQSYCIAAYALEKLGCKTFASYYNEGLSYAVKHAVGFKEYVEGNGGKMVASQTFQSSSKDYSAQAQKIIEAKPDAVFICNYAADNALCYDYLRNAGYTGVILGNNTFQSPFETLVKTKVEKCYFLQNYDMTNTSDFSNSIVSAYMKATNVAYPIANCCFGYDDVQILANSMKKVSDPYDGAALAAELAKTNGVKGCSGTINLNPATHRTMGLPMYIAEYDSSMKIKIITSYTLSEKWE